MVKDNEFYRDFEPEEFDNGKKKKPYKRNEFRMRNWQDFVDEDTEDIPEK